MSQKNYSCPLFVDNSYKQMEAKYDYFSTNKLSPSADDLCTLAPLVPWLPQPPVHVPASSVRLSLSLSRRSSRRLRHLMCMSTLFLLQRTLLLPSSLIIG